MTTALSSSTPRRDADPAPRLVAALLGTIVFVAMLAVFAPAHASAEWQPASYQVPRQDQAAPAQDAPKQTQVGMASWYGPGFLKHKTASGERFSAQKSTAAHPTLPLGTHVRVTNLKNGRTTVVRVNDRGPYAKGRIIDLSPAAAKQLAMKHDGVTPVKLEVID